MERAYFSSHPFLTFKTDLTRAGPSLWLLFGEAQSKCEHLRGVPLPPAVQGELNKVYLAKGVLATTAIEGNTLSEDEVRRHLDGKLDLPPSKEYLKNEIDNILDASNRIWNDELPTELTPALIRQFNASVLRGLEVEQDVIPGEFRTYSVGVPGYRGAPHEDCAYLVDRLCTWLVGPEFEPKAGLPIVYAIAKAVIAHLYLAWIHPFGDGNGRTARLVEVFILVQAGVPMAAAHLLSNHYNSTRAEYYRQLDRASKSGGQIVPFLEYATQGFVDGLREQLKLVRETQLDLAWSDYVEEAFRRLANSPANQRRKLLVRALSNGGWTKRNELTRLNTDVASRYGKKTQKTLTRDINVLTEELKLLEAKADMVRARRFLMLAFRSKSKDPGIRREMHEAQLAGEGPAERPKKRLPRQRRLPLK